MTRSLLSNKVGDDFLHSQLSSEAKPHLHLHAQACSSNLCRNYLSGGHCIADTQEMS